MTNISDAMFEISGLSKIAEDILQDLSTTLRELPYLQLPGLPDFRLADRLDQVGDFLDIYDGPRNGDLDVVVADAVLTAPDEVVLRAIHAAPIGTTQGSAYVWGIDRGAGEELLTELDPPAGEGIPFDSVLILLPDGTGSVIDLAGGGPPQLLDPADIEIAGPLISVRLSRDLLPSRGLNFEDWGYNLWPRYAPEGVNPADNTQISDFAPDASLITARPAIGNEFWSLDLATLDDALDLLGDLTAWTQRNVVTGGSFDLV